MKLKTIEMPKAEARQAFLDYRRAVRERHDAEDAQLMRCYRAVSQGQQVVNLNEAMRRAGEDKSGLPRLAISRADYEQVRLRREWQTGNVEMYPLDLEWRRQRGEFHGRLFRFPELLSIREPSLTRPNWARTARVPVLEYVTIVPNIPPALRPAHDLSNYHLLWEPRWEPIRPTVPRDPALLKHLGGPLYAVLAMWNLSPIEQAVLGVTRN